jgi:hypothetical protein
VNVTLLIGAVLRQTVVLVAELATSGGLRAPLAHVADQVFIELTRELEAQGLNQKVSADMFGMALRSYQRKVQRLGESSTERGRSLWEAVYDFVRSRGITTRKEVLDRFRHDDEELVRGVLADLVESQLVFATGPTQATTFRAASDDELGAMARDRQRPLDVELAWALVFRLGPLSAQTLCALGGFKLEEVESVLGGLVREGRILREESGGDVLYKTGRFVVAVGASTGWEGAVFDHFHAVVRTICTKLRRTTTSSAADEVGGSTYTYEIWKGHPLEGEVLGMLRRFREAQSTLRERIREYNANHTGPAERLGVIVYGGQTVWTLGEKEAKDAIES